MRIEHWILVIVVGAIALAIAFDAVQWWREERQIKRTIHAMQKSIDPRRFW